MPTYEYACPKCGSHFEQFQSMRDEPLKKCVKCGKTGVKRLIGGGAGLIFKGTGFYITDYKKKSGTPDAAEPKPAAGSTETKASPGAATGGGTAGPSSAPGGASAAPSPASK